MWVWNSAAPIRWLYLFQTGRLLKEIGTPNVWRKLAKKTLAFTVNYYCKAVLDIYGGHSYASADADLCTAQKVSVFRVFLVRIFPHLDWIRGDNPYLSIFSLNTGKYGTEKLWIRTLLEQESPTQEITIQAINSYYSFLVYSLKSNYSVLEQESHFKAWDR